MRPVLEALAKHKVYMVVVSNKRGPLLRCGSEGYGL